MVQDAHAYRLFVGIDVSARTVTFTFMRTGEAPSRAHTIEQTPLGFAQLQQHLLTLEEDPAAILVVLEATGAIAVR